jgi:hypothetical protein
MLEIWAICTGDDFIKALAGQRRQNRFHQLRQFLHWQGFGHLSREAPTINGASSRLAHPEWSDSEGNQREREKEPQAVPTPEPCVLQPRESEIELATDRRKARKLRAVGPEKGKIRYTLFRDMWSGIRPTLKTHLFRGYSHDQTTQIRKEPSSP